MLDNWLGDYADEIQKMRMQEEQAGFDSCLGILCKMGHEDIARSVVEEAELLGVSVRYRRSQCRVRVSLDQWPTVYGEADQAAKGGE